MTAAPSRLFGAIEAGGTKMVCAVGGETGGALSRTVLPTTLPEATFAAIRAFFAQACERFGPLSAIGVASFGPVEIDPGSPAYGRILDTPKAGWTGADYRDALQAFPVPVAVTTDVNGAGLGEWSVAGDPVPRVLAYVTVGTGIGAGVISRGAPLSGIGHYELGHIYPPHDPMVDPYAGRCPFHGNCLEGLASGPAIAERWGADLSVLGPDHPALTLEATYLAHLAVTLILAHRPARIVFGGGVMKAPGLLQALRRRTAKLLSGYIDMGKTEESLDHAIMPPKLGDDAGIIGALTLARSIIQDGLREP
ncbi:MAG: ROK family protein [Alphaproteobacteria bacterium]